MLDILWERKTASSCGAPPAARSLRAPPVAPKFTYINSLTSEKRHDAKMYRPVSVTTMEYRILAKCMALKLNLTITHLIGDPQVGFSPSRTYDENIAHVRETIADINNSSMPMAHAIRF